MSPACSVADVIIVAYLVVHALVIVFVDSFVLMRPFVGGNSPWGALGMTGLLDGWAELAGDELVARPPLWFSSILTVEVIFQLPYCLIAAATWHRRSLWMERVGLVYAAHVLTTMVPIVPELVASGARPAGLAVYGVWVALPLLMLWRLLTAPPAAEGSSKAKRT